jgi:hypothetical protein
VVAAAGSGGGTARLVGLALSSTSSGAAAAGAGEGGAGAAGSVLGAAWPPADLTMMRCPHARHFTLKERPRTFSSETT